MRVKDTRVRKLTETVNFLVCDAVGKRIFRILIENINAYRQYVSLN